MYWQEDHYNDDECGQRGIQSVREFSRGPFGAHYDHTGKAMLPNHANVFRFSLISCYSTLEQYLLKASQGLVQYFLTMGYKPNAWEFDITSSFYQRNSRQNAHFLLTRPRNPCSSMYPDHLIAGDVAMVIPLKQVFWPGDIRYHHRAARWHAHYSVH